MLRFIIVCFIFSLTACSPPEKREFQRGENNVSAKEFKAAIIHFDNSIKVAPESPWALKAAREAARVSHYLEKDFNTAIRFYRHMVLYSDSSEERIKSQKEIAYLFFDSLQNYPQAIIEFYKLLQMSDKDFEIATYKLAVARANYYLNQFNQALSEIGEIVRLKITDEIQFDTLLLQGNIFVAQKAFTKAIVVFNDLLKKFPDKSEKENVPLTLTVCYEENFQYKEAIQILEALRNKYSPPEYIELRIKRINERIKNQPGAKGLHRK
jgi:tetratricopeptide (TPR) repeat protein